MAEFIQQDLGHDIHDENITENSDSLGPCNPYLGLLNDTETPLAQHHFEHQLTDANYLPSGSQQFWPSGTLTEVSPQQTAPPNPIYSRQPFTAAFSHNPLQFEPNTTHMQQQHFDNMQFGGHPYDYNSLNAARQTQFTSPALSVNNRFNETTSMFVQHAPNPDPYPGSSYQIESRNLRKRHLERYASANSCPDPQPSTRMHYFMPASGIQANTPCSARPIRSVPPHITTTDVNVVAARPEEGTLSQTTSDVSNRRRLYVRNQVINVSFDTHLQLFRSLPPRTSLNEFMYAATKSYETICTGRQPFSKEEETTSLELIEKEMWKRLAIHTSEMITTKVGRRIFPHLSVNVSSLDPKAVYSIVVDLVQLQPNAMTYNEDGTWTTREATAQYPPPEGSPPLLYLAKDSPQNGEFWMTEGVDLKAAKIIHAKSAQQNMNMMFVHTQHQYMPRYHIFRHLEVKDFEEARNEFRMEQLRAVVVGSFFIPGTQFVAVTRYKNPEIVKVKVDENPFAAGSRKRKREDSSASNSN
ncbi:unnamed protein product [Mesocestoides corti]|uniref:T-box domain-containing protein n=3 Tax=Mesocestoides corti TaxID=53468 RepID=A0A0R3UPF8_MESCO|nr:unnamed protein product [Mesocestoides corti]